MRPRLRLRGDRLKIAKTAKARKPKNANLIANLAINNSNAKDGLLFHQWLEKVAAVQNTVAGSAMKQVAVNTAKVIHTDKGRFIERPR